MDLSARAGTPNPQEARAALIAPGSRPYLSIRATAFGTPSPARIRACTLRPPHRAPHAPHALRRLPRCWSSGSPLFDTHQHLAASTMLVSSTPSRASWHARYWAVQARHDLDGVTGDGRATTKA